MKESGELVRFPADPPPETSDEPYRINGGGPTLEPYLRRGGVEARIHEVEVDRDDAAVFDRHGYCGRRRGPLAPVTPLTAGLKGDRVELARADLVSRPWVLVF